MTQAVPIEPEAPVTTSPRENYRPCVAIVLHDEAGRILLAKRSGDWKYPWQFPQGGIEAGETPRAACLRELHEETGLQADQVEIYGHAHCWHHYRIPQPRQGSKGQVQAWLLLKLVVPVASIDLSAALAASSDNEFAQLAWRTPAAALTNIVPFKHSVYAAALADFAVNYLAGNELWFELTQPQPAIPSAT